jgi:hypothetical protein
MARTSAVSLSLALALLAPAAASAATVTVSPDTTSRLAIFTAAPGEENALSFTLGGPEHLDIADAGAPLTGQPLVDGVGCAVTGAASLLCQPATNLEASLGDEDDTARTRPFFLGRAVVWGGAGDDVMALDSHALYTRAYGGPGDDDLTAGGEGGQLVDGGRGDDRLHVGGFAGGSRGYGGPGDDHMSFFIGLPSSGSGGLEGGGGQDFITLDSPGGHAYAHGDAGADRIEVAAGAEFSSYALAGGDGPDVLVAGPGVDTADGDAGRDTIDTRGGGTDAVTCGAGVDTVRADATDTVAADCERVTLG